MLVNEIYGVNPVIEALKSDNITVEKILIEKGKYNKKIQEIITLAKNRKIKINFLEKDVFKKKYSGVNHQGIFAIISKFSYYNLEEFYNSKFILILDSINDQQNFGSIVRTAEFFGVDAIVIPKNRSVSVNDTTVKTSCGAIFNIPIIKVTNLANSIKKLKENNFFIIATSLLSENSIDDIPYIDKVALIIGNEEKGIRKKLIEYSDFNVKLFGKGRTSSLNASVSAGIFIYELKKRG